MFLICFQGLLRLNYSVKIDWGSKYKILGIFYLLMMFWTPAEIIVELKTGQTFQKKVHFLKSGIYTGSLTVAVGTKPKPWFLVFFWFWFWTLQTLYWSKMNCEINYDGSISRNLNAFSRAAMIELSSDRYNGTHNKRKKELL